MVKRTSVIEEDTRPDGRIERVRVNKGVRSKLGKGPTSVANNTIVGVLDDQTLDAGEIPIFHYGMRSTPTSGQRHGQIKPMDVTSTSCTGYAKKKTNGLWTFEIKHNDGAARDFDWVARKIKPS